MSWLPQLTPSHQIIYWILEATHTLEPTSTLTYADTHMGIPSMLSCLEMVPISLLVVYAYPLTPYVSQRNPETAPEAFQPSYQGGPGGVRAYLAMLSPAENMEALFFAFRMAGEEGRRKKGAMVSEYSPMFEVGAGRR